MLRLTLRERSTQRLGCSGVDLQPEHDENSTKHVHIEQTSNNYYAPFSHGRECNDSRWRPPSASLS